MRAEGETKPGAAGDVSFPLFLLLITSQQNPTRPLSFRRACLHLFPKASCQNTPKPKSLVLSEHLNLFKYRMRQNRNVLPWEVDPSFWVCFQSHTPPAIPWVTAQPCCPQKSPFFPLKGSRQPQGTNPKLEIMGVL